MKSLMKKIFQGVKLLFCIMAIAVAIYVAWALYIGSSVRQIINATYRENGIRPQSYAHIISEENFERINIRGGPPAEIGDSLVENKFITFPIAVHKWNQADVYWLYWYESKSKKTGKLSSGSQNVPCKAKCVFTGFSWTITEYIEHP